MQKYPCFLASSLPSAVVAAVVVRHYWDIDPVVRANKTSPSEIGGFELCDFKRGSFFSGFLGGKMKNDYSGVSILEEFFEFVES